MERGERAQAASLSAQGLSRSHDAPSLQSPGQTPVGSPPARHALCGLITRVHTAPCMSESLRACGHHVTTKGRGARTGDRTIPGKTRLGKG